MKPTTTNQQPAAHHEEISRLSIRQKLNRILQIEQPENVNNLKPDSLNDAFMITRVITKPNPFVNSVTLDVACIQSKHVIVRMLNVEDKIVKMFSWFLVKGINVTTISEVGILEPGTYNLDIVDQDGDVMYSTKLYKEV